MTNPKNDKNIYKVFNNVQYRLLDNKENFSHVVNMALGKEDNCSFPEAADALGVSKETLEQLKTSGLVKKARIYWRVSKEIDIPNRFISYPLSK